MIPIHPRLKKASWQGLKERNRADHQEYKTEIEGKRKSAASILQYFACMPSANRQTRMHNLSIKIPVLNLEHTVSGLKQRS